MGSVRHVLGRRPARRPPLSLRRSALCAVVLAVLAAAAVVGAERADVLAGTTTRAADALWPSGPTDPRVVVVGVDADSIDRTGQAWPWPRDLQAEVVERLTEAGAAVVVLDVVYAPARDGDDALAEAIAAQGRTVVAASTDRVRAGTVVVGDIRLLQTVSLSRPVPAVEQAAGQIGSAVVVTDPDGTARRVPLLVESSDGALVPSLALAAVDLLDGSAGTAVLRPTAVRVDDLDVPVDELAQLTVSWTGALSDGDRQVSAVDVLERRVPDGMLAGAVVLFGVTDPALGDRYVTPASSAGASGVVLQAQAVNTLLTRAWSRPAPVAATAGLTAALALVLAFAALRSRLRWMLVLVPAALGILLAAGVIGFVLLGLLPDLVRPAGALGLAAGSGVAVRSLAEARDRSRLTGLFRRYVPDAVADQLVDSGLAEAAREGQRLEVAVLFCDLRGFTPMAAERSPSEVREVLDAFYEHVCERVFAHSGTVMQFVGDEVFAVFGAPLPMQDPACAAVTCAVELQATATELRDRLQKRALPAVRFGIGVHTGTVVAAHVGPDSRRQYAVVGEAVNLGSRLCGAAAADEVVVSGDAARSAPPCTPTGETLALKGVSLPVPVVRLSPPAG